MSAAPTWLDAAWPRPSTWLLNISRLLSGQFSPLEVSQRCFLYDLRQCFEHDKGCCSRTILSWISFLPTALYNSYLLLVVMEVRTLESTRQAMFGSLPRGIYQPSMQPKFAVIVIWFMITYLVSLLELVCAWTMIDSNRLIYALLAILFWGVCFNLSFCRDRLLLVWKRLNF